MRKEIAIFIVITCISGSLWGAQIVHRAYLDGIYVQIASWEDRNDFLVEKMESQQNVIWNELRQQEIRRTRRAINELEYIREEERPLTKREILRLRDYKQDLEEIKEK